MMRDADAYPDLVGDMFVYDPDRGLREGYDAIVASDWEAAYAAYRYPGDAKRFYFAQDFEPYFFAAGSDYVLAENSYRFGFHGITAGRWLARKLDDEYAMACDSFDFAVDTQNYRRLGEGSRGEVV
ncbi:MAG: glycosyltransferase family 1 protein, partial [Actinomycetota bacterium]